MGNKPQRRASDSGITTPKVGNEMLIVENIRPRCTVPIDVCVVPRKTEDCDTVSIDSFHSAYKDLPSKPLFPYLDTATLDDTDVEELEFRLVEDTRNIKKAFANFTLDVKRSLVQLEIPLQRIKDTILSLDAFPDDVGVSIIDSDDTDEIKKASTLSDVFIVLRKYISFFNHEIMDHLVYQHGANEDHQRLETYVNKFKEFCVRNAFEVPKKAFSKSSQRLAKVFVIKCTEHLSSLNDVKAIRGRIAGILGLNPIALQLSSVKKGCVELEFVMPTKVADKVFPIAHAQQSALNQIGVTVIKIPDTKDIKETELASAKSFPAGKKWILTERLINACGEGLLSAVKSLIEQGADVNEIRRLSRSALLAACTGGHTQIAELLVERGAVVDKCDENDDKSPLWMACAEGHTETAKFLIDHGAEVDKCDKDGKSPVWIASERGHSKIVQLLIAHKADINKTNYLNVAPLIVALENYHSEIVEILLSQSKLINEIEEQYRQNARQSSRAGSRAGSVVVSRAGSRAGSVTRSRAGSKSSSCSSVKSQAE